MTGGSSVEKATSEQRLEEEEAHHGGSEGQPSPHPARRERCLRPALTRSSEMACAPGVGSGADVENAPATLRELLDQRSSCAFTETDGKLVRIRGGRAPRELSVSY